ncbi:Gag-like protein [Marasmius fiardii PR-910]|nr:Gag-like protein [Marasmius fiardii PR-910]
MVSATSTTAMVYFNIWDSQMGSRVKWLIDRQIHIFGHVCFIRPTTASLGVPMCTRCSRWGHSINACRAPLYRCPQCSGPHSNKEHCLIAGCCKGKLKADPLVPPTEAGKPCLHQPICPNCWGKHSAYSQECQFWRHCFDHTWINAKYAEVHSICSTTRRSTHPLPIA